MNIWIVALIIALVMGLIIGNILLLKQSANQKLPKSSKDNNAAWDKDEDN
jgi:uncharacterized membrane-anchored protein YhcB (DUF1043 family)